MNVFFSFFIIAVYRALDVASLWGSFLKEVILMVPTTLPLGGSQFMGAGGEEGKLGGGV